MQNPNTSYQPQDSRATFDAMKLEDYGALQARYSALGLAHRAGAMLADAKPALSVAEEILTSLGNTAKSRQLFEKIRKNAALTGKMRANEARTTLLDSSVDFLDVTRKKLSGWRKTIERLSMGEAIIVVGDREFISGSDPLFAALMGVSSVSSYLSVVQLAIAEQAKADPENASYYNSLVAKLRRAATLISDCENAACITTMVH